MRPTEGGSTVSGNPVNDAQELLERGLHHYGLGEVRRAAQLWLELLQREPEHAEARRYVDYLRGQQPEAFDGLSAESLAPKAAAALDWANSLPSAPAVLVPPPPAESLSVAPPSGDPFELMGPISTEGIHPLVSGATELFGLNDFEGALEAVERAEAEGLTDPRIQSLREQCEAQLLKLYESRLGDLQLVPRTRVGSGEVVWLNLDHRAGFLLSLVDGSLSFDQIFSLSGMSRLETARVLAQLMRDSVIGA